MWLTQRKQKQEDSGPLQNVRKLNLKQSYWIDNWFKENWRIYFKIIEKRKKKFMCFFAI